MAGIIKINVICEDTSITEKVLFKLQGIGMPVAVIVDRVGEALEKIPKEDSCITLIGAFQDETVLEKNLAALRKVNQNQSFLLITKEIDLLKFRQALRAGINEVLQFPEELEELEKTIKSIAKKMREQEYLQEELEKARAKTGTANIIAVYSAKGGSGKTLLASNIAQTIKCKTNNRVLLVDFNLQFGGIQQILNMEKGRSVSDLIPVIYELDYNQIQNVVSLHQNTGLDVLLSPGNPEIAEKITDEHIDLILREVRYHYDYVVIDLPSELNQVSLTALSLADRVFYIVTPDSIALQIMKSVYEIFEKFGIADQNKLNLIINRVSKSNDIKTDDIAKMTPYPVFGQLRADYLSIQTYTNLGKPLIVDEKDKGKTKLAKDILKVVQQMVG